ncbi:hypothetical protein QBC37DRAFT_407198 [Rhypophila decipiens]|uniref:Ecp2 effector protein domain-containing protein n=1 Tax=Rhypophila decipiens TaxID=261697 RepID=A0AAN7B1F1_9PEZI|nr:hypothetical protein QBC37DRAFT_407198 [Rhypophila decipiens]
MKLLSTIKTLLLLTTLVSAAPSGTQDPPPLKVVHIDMDAAALEARNASIDARAPVPGAFLDAWNNGATNCNGNPTFTWSNPDKNVCYEYFSGGLRWKMNRVRYRPGNLGTGCSLAVFDQAGIARDGDEAASQLVMHYNGGYINQQLRVWY